MNAIIRWGISFLVAIVMATGLCMVTVQQAQASVSKQSGQYSQEEKKPSEPGKAAPGEDEESGCKC